MTELPHPDSPGIIPHCGVITLSDTRTPETDRSGQLIQELIQQAGFQVSGYTILPDEPTLVLSLIEEWCHRPDMDAFIFNGGTGIAPRDNTYETLNGLLEKTLPGFGELFRFLSYQEIGSRAIASRALAGTYENRLFFSLPGSCNAVRLGMEKLILPELVHLIKLLSPKN